MSKGRVGNVGVSEEQPVVWILKDRVLEGSHEKGGYEMIKGHLVEGVEHQGEVFECHLVGYWEPLMVSW